MVRQSTLTTLYRARNNNESPFPGDRLIAYFRTWVFDGRRWNCLIHPNVSDPQEETSGDPQEETSSDPEYLILQTNCNRAFFLLYNRNPMDGEHIMFERQFYEYSNGWHLAIPF